MCQSGRRVGSAALGAGGNASAMVAPIVSAYAGSGADLKAAGDLFDHGKLYRKAPMPKAMARHFQASLGWAITWLTQRSGKAGHWARQRQLPPAPWSSTGGNLTLKHRNSNRHHHRDGHCRCSGCCRRPRHGDHERQASRRAAKPGHGRHGRSNKGDFTLEATSSDTGALARPPPKAVVAVRNTIATSNLTDPATALVGTDSIVAASLGTILVQSQTATDVNSQRAITEVSLPCPIRRRTPR